MLLKVLRKTKTIYGVKKFIKEELGKYFIESPPIKLAEVLSDSTKTTPIIFVLSPGADPVAYLMALAAEKGMKDKFKTISLGQGQDGIATRLIDEGSKTGQWICFQNCHLFVSWMGKFEQLLEQQDATLMHDEYRLWLTSDPTSNFPVPIL
jgi:dynein heavy chain, axonemal